jgi:hypothetical protein
MQTVARELDIDYQTVHPAQSEHYSTWRLNCAVLVTRRRPG